MSARTTALLGTLLGVIAGLIVTALLVAHLGQGEGPRALFGRAEIARNGNPQGQPYPGDPDREAALVEAEAERLAYLRTVASTAPWRVDNLDGPYRVRTGESYTLLLTERAAPYTTADLLALAPDTFVRQPDGAYLLSESIAVLAGATLDIASTDGLGIRLTSGEGSFASIVGLGGSLSITGVPAKPVSITSWNPATGSADQETADGRSYLRMIGGSLSVSHAKLSHLGFWSGDTGGLAFTGPDLDAEAKGVQPSPPARGEAAAEPVGGAPLLSAEELAAAPAAAQPPADQQQQQQQQQPAATIYGATLTGNAFGLFVSNASGVSVADTQVSNSLVDGVVFHRFVSDATIARTASIANAVDGFSLARSTTGVTLNQVSALRNSRNGISLDGQALADGPSAHGTVVETYGDNRVTGSTIVENARYGIEISGGRDLEVVSSRIAKNEFGIVVNHGAENVVVAGNVITDQIRHGIAIRDAVQGARLQDNAISGGDTGIYLRNAGADVTGNSIDKVSNHGVTLIGEASQTHVVENTISGYGSTAVWNEDATGGVVDRNDLDGWRPAPTLASVLGPVFQPLTLVWLFLGLLLVATALTRRGQQYRAIRLPYAERVPLTSLSRGIVSRDKLGGPT